MPGVVGGRQGGDDAALAAHQRHLPQRRPGARRERFAHTQRIEQRQVARGDALAAHLAARERLLLDQRDRPAGAREDWTLVEYPAALFSHCLRATRRRVEKS